VGTDALGVDIWGDTEKAKSLKALQNNDFFD